MSLNAISPIDGRYSQGTLLLANYFSESALMRYRALVETEYFIALSSLGKTGLRKLSKKEIQKVKSLYQITEKEFKNIKDIEKTTNHDVKAVEYFIKNKLSGTSLRDSLEWIHFALTSEDTNNISYALMLRDALEMVIIPKIGDIVLVLNKLAKEYRDMRMLSRTHGQPASPTTFGKEMKVFAKRLERQISNLKKTNIEAKLNGATGNYNAQVASYPNIDWLKFSKKFIEGFNTDHQQKLKANLFTTQIECHDSYIEIFDRLKNINSILIGFNQDIWRYVSDGWLGQKPKSGETGSSTMPHKINPIDFENSEGNLGLANSLFEFFSRKLSISRLQRDLSDSTVERSFGTALAHSYLGYSSTLKGLGKIKVNQDAMAESLRQHPEVIAEAIQTILRRDRVEMPYEKLKELTRGKSVTLADLHDFIDGLNISDRTKKELKKLTPETYLGLASRLAVL